MQKRTRSDSLREAADPHAGAQPSERPAPQPQPLFSERHIQLRWQAPPAVGAGLRNLGNTCFMNSVLQAITHVPAFAQLCLSRDPLPHKEPKERSVTRSTQFHVRRALSSGGPEGTVSSSLRPTQPFAPQQMAGFLRTVRRGFRIGRQEDAHEYLRCLLDYMHESHIACCEPKPPPEVQRTSWIHTVFGGRTRSQLQCIGVKYESSIFEPFLDLSLQIYRSDNVLQALANYCAKEVLDGDNKYRCPTNKKLVRAERCTRIQEPPNVLTLHLKRFEFASFGRKIARHVPFPMVLDLAPYLHATAPRGDHKYDLISVVVHHGKSVSSGHYTAFVRSPSGVWHLCDDAKVHTVKPAQVLAQAAYILVYARQQPRHWLLPGGVSASQGRAQAPSHGQPSSTDGLHTRAATYPRVSSASKPPASPHVGGAAAAHDGALRGGDGAVRGGDVQANGSATAMVRDSQDGADTPADGVAEPAQDSRIVSTSTPIRNGRVSAAAAHNWNHYGRATKCAKQMMRTTSRTRQKLRVASPDKGRSTPAPGSATGKPQHSAGCTQDEAGQEDERAEPAAASPAGMAAVGATAPPHMSTEPHLAAPSAGVSTPEPAQAGLPASSSVQEHSMQRIEPGNDELLQSAGHTALAQLGTWDDADQIDVRMAQQAINAAQPNRHHVDAYDADYDRGKVKKVKHKGESAAPGVGVDKFNEAALQQHREQTQVPVQQPAAPRRRSRTRVGRMQTR